MDHLDREKGLLEWFQKELLPEIVSQGRFSSQSDLLIEDCVFEITERGTDHFASCPYFAKLNLKSVDGNTKKTIPFIVKFAHQDASYRAVMDTDQLFQNEAIMYTIVLPAFEEFLANTQPSVRSIVEDTTPSCYLASCEMGPEKALVIMEDLRQKSFKVADAKVELDYEHCKIALQQIARIHAVSFAMKKKNPVAFDELKKTYLEVKFPDIPEREEWGENFYSVCNKRAVDYLRTKKPGLVPEEYLEKFLKKVTTKSYSMMRELVQPEEPLSAIIHGDFCRNNVLFKYKDGFPVDCKIFDFQMFRYATPGIELGFFFYLNTTLEMRDLYFDKLFLIYYDTLIDTVAAILDEDRSSVSSTYTLQAFQKDYAEKAVFGYVLVSFFLPMMMAPPEVPTDWEIEFLTKPMTEFAAENYIQGGDTVSERIAEVLVDFYNRGFYT